MDLDAVKDDVFSKLSLLDVGQLGQCCVQLNIQIPPNKMGKKTGVRSFILRHLTSEEVEDHDDVDDIFRTLNGNIDKMVADKEDKTVVVKKETDVKTEPSISKTDHVKVNTKDTKSSSSKQDCADGTVMASSGTTTRVEFSRFREFKVKNGTFGADCKVNYRSLLYQIKEAKDLKHTEREILSGIISGMKADSALQIYFQGIDDWTLDSCLEHLQNIADTTESTVLLNQMGNTSQEPSESEMNFLLRMFGLRDHIINITAEEDHPLDEAIVRKRFFHALSVGFKRDTVRLELGPLLKKVDTRDPVLMKELNDVVTRDKENREKTKDEKEAACNNLNASGKRGSDDAVLKAISKLTDKIDQVETKVNSISNRHSVRFPDDEEREADEREAKKKREYAEEENRNFHKNMRFIKCKKCEERRVYCTHCNLCGKGGHKRATCPDAEEKNE